MGHDKAFIEIDGEAMVAIAAAALREAGAVRVRCIGGDLPRLRALGFEVVADRHPGEGPLGALVTALAACDAALLHVLTCDLPLVDASVVRPVVAALAARPAMAVAAPTIDGRLQYLSATYRTAVVRGPTEAAFERGERAVRAGLAGLPVVAVPGLDVFRLTDADTPCALAAHLPPVGATPGRAESGAPNPEPGRGRCAPQGPTSSCAQ